ncbi:alpha/beta hydrolase [Nocardia sp. CA-129566]|uniref:alpha/beta hydrolase n=1 Tax=Nocardia sp. CA-129566 TaxID=3239976 RepID=UPI003D969BC4
MDVRTGPGLRAACLALLATAALTLPLAKPVGVATAEPAARPSDAAPTFPRQPNPAGARLLSIGAGVGRMLDVTVHSAAMDTDIRLKVLPAQNDSSPAPTLYLLNGASGGNEGSTWFDQTDIAEFFADEHVNVVIPVGGAGSYFTDWHNDDPVLGRPRWTTFLTRELPPIIDSAFHTTGTNAIAGISMAATSVFQLALAAPGLYRAIGSYSGCIQTSDPQGQGMIAAVVGRWGGNPINMWGPPTDPTWAANDPYVHADQLRGTTIYVATGSGLPGTLDTPDAVHGNIPKLVGQLTGGVILEVITNQCAHRLQDRLREQNIPAIFDLRPTGTHSWGYWQQDLHNSWPHISAALN